MRKNYVIMVGRGCYGGKVYHVCCSEEDIQTVALAHYYSEKDKRIYEGKPICCIYAEGEEFDIHNPDNVVLIDCM